MYHLKREEDHPKNLKYNKILSMIINMTVPCADKNSLHCNIKTRMGLKYGNNLINVSNNIGKNGLKKVDLKV